MRESKTWALVVNSGRARILRGLEDGDGEDQIEILRRAPSTHLLEFLTNRLGRSFSSDRSGRRSAIEPGSDPLHRDMQDFAEEISDLLEKHRRAGDFRRLAIFAEPRMLGILRKEFPATLWSVVFLSRAKNLTSLPESELRRRVLENIKTERWNA